jgi:hypothetical protein
LVEIQLAFYFDVSKAPDKKILAASSPVFPYSQPKPIGSLVALTPNRSTARVRRIQVLTVAAFSGIHAFRFCVGVSGDVSA